MAYNICTIFFGKNGIYTFNHNQAELVRLSENIENLKNIEKELTNIKKDFSNNPDSRSVFLQRYGFTPPDQKNITIVGYNIGNSANRHSGQIVYAQEAEMYFDDTVIKIAATIFSLIVLISLFILNMYSKKTDDLHT